MKSALVIGALVIVTALSAYFDARGFVYAAQTWREGSLVPGVVFLALVNFMGALRSTSGRSAFSSGSASSLQRCRPFSGS